MKQIVYVVPSLIKSGPIDVLYNIIRHLNRKEYTPTIIALSEHCLVNRNNQSLFDELDVEVRQCNYKKWYLQTHSHKLAHLLQDSFPHDVIFHAHGYYPTLILSKMKEAKSITTIHNICEEDFVLRFGQLMGRWMAYTYKRSLRKLTCAVPICDAMKDHYIKQNGTLNLFTVSNGVELPTISFGKDKQLLKKEIGISADVKVLLYPAAFSSRKNHPYIISEMKLCKRKDVVVLFAGQGETENNCKDMAQNDERFRFLGYQKDLNPYWEICDFMISSSVSEGMPMAVLEAVVRGVPCILSYIAPHREIEEKVFGSDRLCFDVSKTGSLSLLLESVLDEKYNHKQIREKGGHLYSAEAMSNGYQKIYSNL